MADDFEPGKDGPEKPPSGDNKKEVPLEEKPKLSFRDLAFKKDENGEYYVNVIDPNSYTSASDFCPSEQIAASHTLGRFEMIKPETLSIHEPDFSMDPWQRLEALIGLEGIKKQLRQIEMRIEFDRKRRESGLQNHTPANHFVFLGNPGTGKNEVARILGALLHKAGVLSRGHVVEVDRSDLVGGYVGWSAIKTREVVQVAKGGILFVDEAYALWQDPSWDFGPEVISTLLKEMEDNRQDIIVILAGPNDMMQPLLNSNPGLKSRIRHYIEFKDYKSEELFEIFGKFCTDSQYRIDDDVTPILRKIFEQYSRFLNKTEAGNARFVRNVFEKTLEKMAARVIEQKLEGIEHLQLIRAADIPKLEEVTGARKEYKSISEKVVLLRPRDTSDKDGDDK